MTRQIPVGKDAYALVDDADYEWLSKFSWSLSDRRPGMGYARRTYWVGERSVSVAMHRLILGASADQMVDHANRIKLDNRRSNLRFCTKADNMRNVVRTKAGYRGAYRHCRAWRAMIRVDGRTIHTGNCATQLEAAAAYDRLAKEHHGEFAILNFPAHRDWILPGDHRGAWPPSGGNGNASTGRLPDELSAQAGRRRT